MTRLNNIMAKEEEILKEGESVLEAQEMRVGLFARKMLGLILFVFLSQTKFGSSVTVTVSNFTKLLFSAVRTCTQAGEVRGSRVCAVLTVCCQIEVPQCDVKPLGKESFLCKRITRPSTK